MTEKHRKPSRRHRRHRNLMPLCVVLALILGGLIFAAWQLHNGTALDTVTVMPDVNIGGFQMGGLSKDQAKDLLRPIGEACANTPLVIHIQDDTHTFTAKDLGLSPDTDKAVDDAFRNGTTGYVDLLPYLGVDPDRIQGLVTSFAERYNQALSRATCDFSGTAPDLTAAPTEGEPEQVLRVTLGRPEFGLDAEDLYAKILMAFQTGKLEITALCRELEPALPDLQPLWEQSYRAPVDAVLDNKTFTVTPEVWGYGFDLEAANATVAAAGYGETVTIPLSRIEPEFNAQEVGGHLFRDVLGEAQTPYKGSDSNNRNTNLAIACAAINGVVLMPGETFSYNDTLGERTAAKGYKPAPSYEGGLTVDTLGGGICQISSTLYYSTLFADLETVRRYNHGYVSDYIDPGMDATVTWGGADFKFRNNTDYPIRIEAWRADGYVNVKIYGTDTRDYYVKMAYEILSTTKYETVYQEMTADNEKGYKDGDTIVTPYRGVTAKAYKEKYSKATGELLSREQESYNVYKKRDRVVCKIVTETTAPTQGENETELG